MEAEHKEVMTDPIEFEKEKSEDEEKETKVQFEPPSEEESRCATRTIVRDPDMDEAPQQDEEATTEAPSEHVTTKKPA